MRSLDEALAEVARAFVPNEAVELSLADACGLCLATEVAATRDAPPFDNSAMDGFAVRSTDVAAAGPSTPVVLPLAPQSRAGGAWPEPLAAGSAAPIFTGAPLPEGADAVVVREDASRDETTVALRFSAPPGHHVRRRGEDLRAGDQLAAAGEVIDPGLVALLASQGHGTVRVHRRPRVAVLVTGDELLETGHDSEAGTLLDSNGPMLAALLQSAGAEPVMLPRAPDQLAPLTEAVREGLSSDLLVTTGGVSVGDHDHVRAALMANDVALGFWKVALKPGKPLVFGTRNQRGVALGLPGNPVSAFVTFHLFVRPVVRRLLGDAQPWPRLFRGRVAERIRHSPGRTELVRVTLAWRGGEPWATPCASQGSGALSSLGRAEALLVLPAGAAALEVGAPAWLWPLRLAADGLPPLD